MCPLRVSKERLTVAPDAMGMVEAAPVEEARAGNLPNAFSELHFCDPYRGSAAGCVRCQVPQAVARPLVGPLLLLTIRRPIARAQPA
jgi:hypothetical protein